MTDAAPLLCIDFEAEAAALSAALANDAALEAVLVGLESADFYYEDHRAIFAAMWKLAAADQPIDPVTIRRALPAYRRRNCTKAEAADLSAKRTERIGGYLHVLAESFIDATNVRAYIAAVRTEAVKRNTLARVRALEQAIGSANGSIDELPRKFTDIAESTSAEIRRRLGTIDEDLIVTAAELANQAPETADFLVYGYLARGAVTELAAKIKVGKTRFALDLVAAILLGDDFLSHATEPASVLYLTEEGRPSFNSALARIPHLAAHERLHVYLRQSARGRTWEQVGQHVAEYIATRKIDVVVVDTLGDWGGLTGDSENDAGEALRVMRPLRDWAAAGAAVLAIRHERKGAWEIGESARGSSAYGGAMDILMSLRRTKGQGNENRRELACVGRFDAAPPEVTIELRDERYQLIGVGRDLRRTEALHVVEDLLPDNREAAIGLEEILAGCPDMARTTVQRTLSQLYREGVVDMAKVPGEGGHGVRHLYWLGSVEDDL